MEYNNEFKQIINEQSKLNQERDIIESFIGTGNPNSNIIIFGKELGFSTSKIDQYNLEVLNNIKDWKFNIENQTNIKDLKQGVYNPLMPYDGCKQKSGHTWTKYQIIYDTIFEEGSSFFERFFISEIGSTPSKYSQYQGLSSQRRKLITESSFFQKFKIVILACGNYLKSSDIESIFKVKHFESRSMPRMKFEIYRSEDKLIINTRQLSMDVKTEYLVEIANEIAES